MRRPIRWCGGLRNPDGGPAGVFVEGSLSGQRLAALSDPLPAQLRSAVRRPAITAAGRREVFGAASFRIVPSYSGVGARPRLIQSAVGR
jgi:hypothetical protein